MDALDELRESINNIDQQIMELLDERFTISVKVGAIKSENNVPVLDSSREQTIYNKTSKYSHSPQIKEVYKTIMNESKALQRK